MSTNNSSPLSNSAIHFDAGQFVSVFFCHVGLDVCGGDDVVDVDGVLDVDSVEIVFATIQIEL